MVCLCDMGGTTYYDLDLKGPIAGDRKPSQRREPSGKVNCDFVASIPMKGNIDSLYRAGGSGNFGF